MTMLQPIARTWGRIRHREVARRDLPPVNAIPGPATEMVEVSSCSRITAIAPRSRRMS